jgi:hypothetical protein
VFSLSDKESAMETDSQTQPAGNKTLPCACTMVLGVLVIVFAWWKVGWGHIALTVVGALVILRGLINQCCCSGAACKPAAGK